MVADGKTVFDGRKGGAGLPIAGKMILLTPELVIDGEVVSKLIIKYLGLRIVPKLTFKGIRTILDMEPDH